MDGCGLKTHPQLKQRVGVLEGHRTKFVPTPRGSGWMSINPGRSRPICVPMFAEELQEHSTAARTWLQTLEA